jgi:hypothetical protein
MIVAAGYRQTTRVPADVRAGVTFAIADDPVKANVEARAASGDFEFTYPPDIPKQTIRFDGKGTHGLCKPLLSEFIGRSRVAEYRMAKAIIYVPANPMDSDSGTLRALGDPIKLVIAVHELIHACGLVSNDEHSVDDVFCWPQLRTGATGSEDRVGTLGEEYTFGKPPRVGRTKPSALIADRARANCCRVGRGMILKHAQQTFETLETGVGRLVVVLVEEGPEPDVDVVEGGELAEEVEASLTQRAPEALHLAARRRVVRTSVHQRDSESGARELEPLRAANGSVAGVLIRSRVAIEGEITIATREIASGVFQLTVRIENLTPIDAPRGRRLCVLNSRQSHSRSTLPGKSK